MKGKAIAGMIFVSMFVFFFSEQVRAEEKDAEMTFITYVPVYAKKEQLVPVELAYPRKEAGRHRDIEQAFCKNDWRPLLSVTDPSYESGVCAVAILSNEYDVNCWHDPEKPSVERHERLRSIEDVIAVVNEFSRKWATKKVATKK